MKLRYWLWGTLLWGAQSCSAADTVLRFAWWGGSDRHDAIQQALRLFESHHPGLRIRGEPQAFSGFQERLAEQLAHKQEPDVINVNWAWISRFSPRGEGFTDLYQYRNFLHLDDFQNESYKQGLIFGKLNALPLGYSARVFFWQKQVFDKAGLPLPKTWDELLVAGRVFHEKLGPEYYPLDGDAYDIMLMTHAYIYQKTGKPLIYPNQAKIALSRDEILEWLRFYKQLYAEHVVVPRATRLAIGDRPSEQYQAWADGKWAGIYTWDVTLSTRASTTGKTAHLEVGDFLTMPGARNSGMFGRPGGLLVVSKNSKNPEMASHLVDFLLNDPEALRLLAVARRANSTINARAADAAQMQHFDKKALEQISRSRIDLPSVYFESAAVQSALRAIFEKVALGQMTENEATNRLILEVGSILCQVDPAVQPAQVRRSSCISG